MPRWWQVRAAGGGLLIGMADAIIYSSVSQVRVQKRPMATRYAVAYVTPFVRRPFSFLTLFSRVSAGRDGAGRVHCQVRQLPERRAADPEESPGP